MGLTRLSRRSFLRTVAAGTCGAAVHNFAYPGTGMFAYATPPVQGAFSANPVMVLVNKAGGCSYNCAPNYNQVWRDKNPVISYGPETSLPLTAEQGLHPALTELKRVYDLGNLALFNMVGYPDPNRSHEESTQIWYRAVRNGSASEGWAARLTSQVPSFFGGISLAGVSTLIRGGTNPPRAFDRIDQLGENQVKWNDNWTQQFRDTRDALMSMSNNPPSDTYNHVRDAMINIEKSVALIKEQTSTPLPTIQNPFPDTGFGQACRDAARLILAPALGVRFIFMQMGGFDTHSDEKARLTQLLTEMNGGYRSLIQTIAAAGRWGDVVIAEMSEFTRTYQNASLGTDHGEGAPLVVFGGSVAGGVKNSPPSNATIQANSEFLHGYEVDFRQIYATIVAAMGFNADLVFPERVSFSPVDLFH